MENEFRSNIIKALNTYYSKNGINPNLDNPDNFACVNKDKCNGDLARGMQCGIGALYGEKRRILIVSLDCGGGGAAVIEKRTEDIQKHLFNPHMKGTLYCTSMLLGYINYNSINPWEQWTKVWNENNKDFVDKSIPYFAMTNACKCCRLKQTKKLEPKYYRKCADHKLREIELLNPDIVIFQGNDSRIKCWDYFSDIEGLKDSEISGSLKKMKLGERTFFAVLSIHPSAPQKKRVNTFMNQTFPKIVQFVNSKI